MSADDEVGPPDPELEAFFAAERARPEASEVVRHAALGRVLRDAGRTPALVPRAVAVAIGLGGLALGALLGALGHAALTPEPEVVRVEAPAPEPEIEVPLAEPVVRAPVIEPHAEPEAEPVVIVEPEALPAPRPLRAPRDAGGEQSSLADELALISRAQTALQRGLPESALSAVDEHARRYPRGAMVEEREALAVQALARANRMDAARARASRFEARYPRSLLIPLLRAAVDETQ